MYKFELVLQLIMKELITVEQIDGKEDKVLKIIREEEINALKEIVRTAKAKEMYSFSNGQDKLYENVANRINELK